MENAETRYLQSIRRYIASEPIAPIVIKTLQGTGIINIASIPPSADVYLNGDLYGKTPITITDIEPGEHTYMLKLLGYTDYVSKVDVKIGELCCQTVDLEYSGSARTCIIAPVPIPTSVETKPSGGALLAAVLFVGLVMLR